MALSQYSLRDGEDVWARDVPMLMVKAESGPMSSQSLSLLLARTQSRALSSALRCFGNTSSRLALRLGQEVLVLAVVLAEEWQ